MENNMFLLTCKPIGPQLARYMVMILVVLYIYSLQVGSSLSRKSNWTTGYRFSITWHENEMLTLDTILSWVNNNVALRSSQGLESFGLSTKSWKKKWRRVEGHYRALLPNEVWSCDFWTLKGIKNTRSRGCPLRKLSLSSHFQQYALKCLNHSWKIECSATWE